jgi:hypothetical protein
MSVSYGGIPLVQETPFIRDWIKEYMDPRDVWAFARRNNDSPRLAYGAGPSYPDWPVEVGKLRWPRGAQRWAAGHFLASDLELAALRPLIYSSSTPYLNAQNLVMDDGAGGVLTARLYLLPPQPLQQIQGSGQLYLLNFVDQRYFWWYTAAALTVADGVTTWAQVYAALGAALGVTINADPVAAAYLLPPAGVGADYEDMPPLLDAVAWSVGQQIVCGTDGTVRATNVTSSQISVQDQTAAFLPQVLAGGYYELKTP